ncbi:DoxX family protein [Gammaproteobacteria bacterium]|nr:DoxX family protein [Gammaproteobacteria bacterium]|tara:strand:- start:806 stop:1246 length:441 start_codon:yes stop_codon:yes gene_type:complete
MKFLSRIHNTLKGFEALEFLPLFMIRLYLFYVLWFAGINKIDSFDKFSGYLGTLGVPFPDIFTWLVIITEAGGAALILIGLFVRWSSIPLLVVMFFAGYLVHWQNGWPHEANGIEFAAIYSLMLLTLLCFGGGKYLSLDYWVSSNK